MMVVIYFSKKRLKEATRAWIGTSLFGSLLQIVSTTHKKISKPRHTSYSAHRRSISWRRPCFCRRSFLLLTDFSYSLAYTSRTQPPEQLKGLLDLPNTTTITTRGSLGRIFILVSSPPAYTVGACCMLQVYGVIMGLNTFCNLILK